MNVRRRAFAAGGVGMVVAFGIVELVHGLYQLVPSVLTAVAQRIIELTPGDAATTGIAVVGKAATPILISVIVILTLLFAGFLVATAGPRARPPGPAGGRPPEKEPVVERVGAEYS